MTMVEQHLLAFNILWGVGILSLPLMYLGIYIAVIRADRQERAASVDRSPEGQDRHGLDRNDESAVAVEDGQTP